MVSVVSTDRPGVLSRTPSPADLSIGLRPGVVRRVSTMSDLERLLVKARASCPVPVVLVSLAPGAERPRISMEDLQEVVSDRAAILLMGSSRLGFAFGEEHPDLRCSGGALRTYYPNGRVARAIVIMDEPGSGVDVEAVLDRVDDDLYDWERNRPQETQVAPAEAQTAEAEELAAPLGDAPVVAPGPSARERELEQEVSDLKRELEAIAKGNRELKAANRSLDQRLADALSRLHPVVHSDPERQFRFEVEHWFLVSTDEQSRQEQPLRGFDLGPDFMDSLASLGALATRERVLQVVCDVLTRAAFSMPARSVHVHKIAGGNATVRESDSATAYRCSVKSESPGAARLLWWERVDGTVELGKVGHHDDYSLR